MSLSNARPTSHRRKWLSTKILQRLRQDWSIGTTKGFMVLVLAAFILTAVASSTVLSAQFQLLNQFPATVATKWLYKSSTSSEAAAASKEGRRLWRQLPIQGKLANN